MPCLIGAMPRPLKEQGDGKGIRLRGRRISNFIHKLISDCFGFFTVQPFSADVRSGALIGAKLFYLLPR